MDMVSGKALDEACNRNNDRFTDEALYIPWVNLPRRGSSVSGERVTACFRTFMARLSARQHDL